MAGYILKIMIEDTHPPVWRRIVVPEKITFEDLHDMIQIIFDWDNDHLHDFRIPSKHICIDSNEEEWDLFHYREEETQADTFLLENKWIRYTYDFGDEWRHKIIYEKTDETYKERYASLLKFRGDNYIEDCGGIWGDKENEYRSAFEAEKVKQKLKGLICPVCDSAPVQTPEKSLDDLMELLMGDLKQKFGPGADGKQRKPSQMDKKIEDLRQLLENENVEVEIKKSAEKTNEHLLMALGYQEAKDYCKYLQIPTMDSWSKEQLAAATADAFRKHPEYLLYVLEENEYKELLKSWTDSEGKSRINPEDMNIWAKILCLGLADVIFPENQAEEIVQIEFACDLAELLKPLSGNARTRVCHRINTFSNNLEVLMLFYGVIELQELRRIYEKTFHIQMEETDFNRFVYWHARFNNLIQTAVAEDGSSYAAMRDINLGKVVRLLDKYAGDMDYQLFPAAELKKKANNIGCRSGWVEMLFSRLCWGLKMPEETAAEVLEESFCDIMNGDNLKQIMEALQKHLLLFHIQTGLADKCKFWEMISGLTLEIELPMFKGRSRLEYGREKNISPWTLEMGSSAVTTANTKNRPMYEFPADIQEKMFEAVSYVNRKAMGQLLQYKEEGQIRSEEFLYLLAEAHITGCEWDTANVLLDELERSSKPGKQAAQALRERLQQGMDTDDDEERFPWDAGWMPEEEKAVPYVRESRKIGRNEPCPCGSGKKYKNCCGR